MNLVELYTVYTPVGHSGSLNLTVGDFIIQIGL